MNSSHRVIGGSLQNKSKEQLLADMRHEVSIFDQIKNALFCIEFDKQNSSHCDFSKILKNLEKEKKYCEELLPRLEKGSDLFSRHNLYLNLLKGTVPLVKAYVIQREITSDIQKYDASIEHDDQTTLLRTMKDKRAALDEQRKILLPLFLDVFSKMKNEIGDLLRKNLDLAAIEETSAEVSARIADYAIKLAHNALTGQSPANLIVFQQIQATLEKTLADVSEKLKDHHTIHNTVLFKDLQLKELTLRNKLISIKAAVKSNTPKYQKVFSAASLLLGTLVWNLYKANSNLGAVCAVFREIVSMLGHPPSTPEPPKNQPANK